MKRLDVRIRVELVLATIGAALFLMTLASPRWIEELFGAEPDAGSGALELAIALGFLGTSVMFGFLARATRRRMRRLPE